jgi:hypothetical protein
LNFQQETEIMPDQNAIHPAPREFSEEQLGSNPILRYFHYSHLPPTLRTVSAPFCALASLIVETLPQNAERTVALRKLLEAKDAAVRANVTGRAQRRRPFSTGFRSSTRNWPTRLRKLEAFLAEPAFFQLPAEQQELLHTQRSAMQDYLDTLELRIDAIMSGTQGQAAQSEEIDEGVRVTGGGQSEDPLPFRDGLRSCASPGSARRFGP